MEEPNLLLKMKAICQNYQMKKSGCSCTGCPLSYKDPYDSTIYCDLVPLLYGKPSGWGTEDMINLRIKIDDTFNNLVN